MEFYIDGEFDAVYHHGEHIQCLISIGIVAAKNGKLQDTYYSLIRPRYFCRLNRVVQKMTQLRSEDIHQARAFAKVMNEAAQFILTRASGEDITVYSFGPDDSRTLNAHAKHEAVKLPDVFTEIVNIQRTLSQTVTWNETMLSPTLSLDDLKFVYGIQGEVIHNALNDAVDLMLIHEAARQGKVCLAKVKALWKQKEQHKQAVRRRNQEKMMKVLNERYGKYVGQVRRMVFYPDVIEQLMAMKDSFAEITIGEKGIDWQDRHYPYSSLLAKMRWENADALQVSLCFHLDAEKKIVICPLTYRNAARFESIWRMMESAAK